jgi:hypothetical protein
MTIKEILEASVTAHINLCHAIAKTFEELAKLTKSSAASLDPPA